MRPVFDDHQAVVGHVGGWRDIHREVQVREAFAAERVRLRATIEGMIDPLVIIEPIRDEAGQAVDFTFIDANSAACAWFQADRDRLVGARLCESLPEIESAGLLRQFAALADTGHPLMLDDFPFVRRGGGRRRLDVRGMRDGDWISLVWRDVTERHEMTERLIASEEQFRLLAENSTDVIVRLDANDRVRWVSPSVTAVLGWNPADCIGRNGGQFLATAETREQYDRDKALGLAGQGAVSRGQVRSAAGDVHWMEAHTFPYRTSEGVVGGTVVSLRLVDAEVRIERTLERRASVDDVTGLFNRAEILERLDALVTRGEERFAVLWCDIDRFKAINDSHGHAAGDAVLEALGARIRGCLPTADDIGGRIGGDELMLILRGIGGLDDAVAVAETLRRRVAEPIPAGDHLIQATISIGVTLAGPHEGIDAFLARADGAMYEAKESGRNRIVAVPPPAAVLAGTR